MKLYIRAHDLGVKGLAGIMSKLNEYDLDGVQMVAYKCFDDVKYSAGSISKHRAEEIHFAFGSNDKTIPLIGAYFNPVHSDSGKVELGKAVFKDYLTVANSMGCNIVGSETGSFNDDKWTYHPKNRTDKALETVANCFTELAKFAAQHNANIAIEGAFGHVCHSVSRLKQAVDMINQPNVKIIFDLFNYLAVENVEQRNAILLEGLNTFGNQIEIFHLKDCILTEDGQLKQVAVGKGIFDYDFILSEISKLNPKAKLVLEGTTGNDIKPSIEFLRQKLAKLNI